MEYKEFSDSATMSPVYLDFLSVNSEGKGRLVAMALALYRRYRPDTFEGVIGQDQVTVPLMRALDEGKLTHAYLFSGPRGCGKTSSARILARCVNCAKGPTVAIWPPAVLVPSTWSKSMRPRTTVWMMLENCENALVSPLRATAIRFSFSMRPTWSRSRASMRCLKSLKSRLNM